ncbi:MAG: Holliday junction branch migration protein RuvA [Clostridia bacterium]|nr:Holliday junction branch migration protein RuvA [Clostridia bacterium]
MINYIKGTFASAFEGGVVIETGGIGYEIHTPENSGLYRAAEGQEITAYTMMAVREDDISLYGFSDKESLATFRKLITVSGVGAKAALAILSAMPFSEVHKAIIFEDVAALTRANGIGKKTAQRIVLELKDKLGSLELPQEDMNLLQQGTEKNDEKSEAVKALVALGYSKTEAVGALTGISGENMSAEDYIKKALKNLF